MIKQIKSCLKKLIYGYKANSKTYVAYLRKCGCTLGENIKFIDPRYGWIDITRPWLVRIGSNVTITPGVTLLTHDYGWSVLQVTYGEVIGNARPVIIGNNVFIGTNTIILGGTTIGDNVIIGANSTVTGKIPSSCVVAGNPAKVICTLEEYRKKRIASLADETKTMLHMYYEKYQQVPTENILFEHFWVCENSLEHLNPTCRETLNWNGDKEKNIRNFLTHTPEYEDYNELLKACNIDLNNHL